MSIHISQRIANYHYSPTVPLFQRSIAGTVYIIGIASAYNAFGLIGPEHNGIFVLDDTAKRVLLDREAESASGGYYGPSSTQLQWFGIVTGQAARGGMTDAEFVHWVRNHPRYRGDE